MDEPINNLLKKTGMLGGNEGSTKVTISLGILMKGLQDAARQIIFKWCSLNQCHYYQINFGLDMTLHVKYHNLHLLSLMQLLY